MRNKLLAILTSVMLSCLCLFTLTACEQPHEHSFTNYISDNNATYDNDGTKTAVCDREGCEVTDTINDDGTKLISHISFNTLSLEELNAYGVVSNQTTEFNFNNEVTINGYVDYVVSYDKYGSQQVLTKVVPLYIGNNTFYVFEMQGTNITKTYEITLRRRQMHNVYFNALGSYVESQSIEEDSLAVEPSVDPIRAGYTFDGWDYDFSTPITSNITISAKWLAIFNCSNGKITGLTSHGKTLREIVIPDSIDGVKITSIGYRAFYNCDSLTSIVIPDSVTSIGEDAFYDCGSLNYNVKGNLKYLGNSENPYLYLADTTSYSITTATIDNNCKIISDSVFSACTSLTSVTIGNSVTSIGNYTFEHCRTLTNVTIGNGVTSIGDWAFYSCYSLTSIVIPDSVTSIGDLAFYDCRKLTSIVIPDSVTSIGDYAFYYCDSLTSIKYRGSQSQWSAISKGYGWDYNTGNYTITYNYDGE